MFWGLLTKPERIYFAIGCIALILQVVEIILVAIFMSRGKKGKKGNMFNGDLRGDWFIRREGEIAFLLFGAWIAFACVKGGTDWRWSVLVFAGCGIIALFAIRFGGIALTKRVAKGEVQSSEAVGKQGEVYKVIPAGGEGNGKVNLALDDKDIEIEAVTNSATSIGSGEQVEVVAVRCGTYIVDRVKDDEIVDEDADFKARANAYVGNVEEVHVEAQPASDEPVDEDEDLKARANAYIGNGGAQS